MQQPVRLSLAQQQAVSACPFHCEPSIITDAHQPGPLGGVQRSFCRCMVCLASWWVDRQGCISHLNRPSTVAFCATCLKPRMMPGLAPERQRFSDFFCDCPGQLG